MIQTLLALVAGLFSLSAHAAGDSLKYCGEEAKPGKRKNGVAGKRPA